LGIGFRCDRGEQYEVPEEAKGQGKKHTPKALKAATAIVQFEVSECKGSPNGDFSSKSLLASFRYVNERTP
jgi:hypothetical protein